MAELRHAPYAGTDPPMAIGLKALDLAQWIEPDEHLAGELAEKRQLLAERHSEVYAERSELAACPGGGAGAARRASAARSS